MSSGRVLAEHSSRELTEWRAFDRAYGLSFTGDGQAGTIAAAVWNAAGGIPEGGEQRRAATVGDFFTKFDQGAEGDEPRSPSHQFHDEADEDEPLEEPDLDDTDEIEVVDDDGMTEAERATQALKASWALFGLRHNAALRKADELEARLEAGEPPENPEMN